MTLRAAGNTFSKSPPHDQGVPMYIGIGTLILIVILILLLT